MQSAFLILILMFTTACSSLLYHPDHFNYVNTNQLTPKPIDVTIPMQDGSVVHGWFFASKNPSKGTIVFFHGNAENLTSHFRILHWLLKYDYSYFIFDYPGFGQSTGSPTPETTVNSGIATLYWVNTNTHPQNLFIYGQSLGGIVALRSAIEVSEKIHLKGLILDGTFTSYQRAGQKVLANNWLTWPLQSLSYISLSDEWAPKDFSKLNGLPKLVIHGKKDPIVDFSLGEELFEALSDPKNLYLIENGQHGDSFLVSEGIHQKKLLEFLEQNRE